MDAVPEADWAHVHTNKRKIAQLKVFLVKPLQESLNHGLTEGLTQPKLAPSPSQEGIWDHELIRNKCHSFLCILGRWRKMGNSPRLQSGAQVAAVSSLLLCFLLLLGNREQRTALPRGHRTNARPDAMGSTRAAGRTPPGPSSWWLKLRPPLPADVPSGKGHPDPGLSTSGAETSPVGEQGCVGTSARESGPTGGQVVSPSPASHIPSASLGSDHTPHTEETQSTDSGFLDTPVASKNSQAMTKQIGIWTANNSRTSLLGRACASLCWVLLPLPSPAPDTVSCC